MLLTRPNCESTRPFWCTPAPSSSLLVFTASTWRLFPNLRAFFFFSSFRSLEVGTTGCGNWQIFVWPPGLAEHHHFCFWHVQPEAVTLALCHSSTLNLFFVSNLKTSVSQPSCHLWISLSHLLFFPLQLPPDVASPFTSLILPFSPPAELYPCLSILLSPFNPHRNREVLHSDVTVPPSSTRSSAALGSTALTWQENHNSSHTFVTRQCTVVFLLIV